MSNLSPQQFSVSAPEVNVSVPAMGKGVPGASLRLPSARLNIPAPPQVQIGAGMNEFLTNVRQQALQNSRADREAIYAKHGLTLPPD